MLVALLTVWWTIGIGNLVYALIAHYTADQGLIKQEQPMPDAAPVGGPSV